MVELGRLIIPQFYIHLGGYGPPIMGRNEYPLPLSECGPASGFDDQFPSSQCLIAHKSLHQLFTVPAPDLTPHQGCKGGEEIYLAYHSI